ncbi:MAG: cation:dicarboxylate symporter family transporter, partial [Cetobacterium somerae]
GAPGGGLVGEMLIVSLFGFPPEAFPIVATLGFLVDPMATCLNAAGDTIASMMVSRVVEGEKWIEENKEEVLTV